MWLVACCIKISCAILDGKFDELLDSRKDLLTRGLAEQSGASCRPCNGSEL